MSHYDPLWNIKPQPPQWAMDAGVPPPRALEGIGAYCERLGLPYTKLVEGLGEITAVNVHIRFANMLADENPGVWRQHVADWIAHARR